MEPPQSDLHLHPDDPNAETRLQESMRQLVIVDTDSYPDRQGQPNCVHYVRTGSCAYGAGCRFNHPHRHRGLGAGTCRDGVEYPEREGQPMCKYYLKTRTCKFGPSCKFHHPKYQGGSFSGLSLNDHGYPLRLGEKECSYYMQTGQCKFGINCKFHHPQPAATSVSASATVAVPTPAFYQTVQSSLVPSNQQYRVPSNWQLARPPILGGSYIRGAYDHMLLPSGMVHISGWNPYPLMQAPVGPIPSPNAQSIIGGNPFYGMTQLSSTPAYSRSYPSFPSSTSMSSNFQNEMYPERPGEPECQYYMRTGQCKFGFSCRYHHPTKY